MKLRRVICCSWLSLTVSGCGPALWLPPREPVTHASVDVRASEPPVSIVDVATSSGAHPAQPSVVTVDMGGGAGGVEVPGVSGSINMGAGAGTAPMEHTLAAAHVVMAGASDLVSPSLLVFSSGEIPADAVIVSGTLEVAVEPPAGAGGAMEGGESGSVGVRGPTVGGGGARRGANHHGRDRGRGRGQGVVVVQADVPATRELRGGSLVLESPDGAQWAVDIDGGDMDAAIRAAVAGGQPPSVIARLRVRGVRQTRLARGAARATPNVVASGANSDASARPVRHRRTLSPRERLALSTLLQVHADSPNGSAGLDAAARAVEDEEVATDDGPPMFYQIPIVGRRLVIAVDVSYSMRDSDPQAHSINGTLPSKLDMLRAQLAKLLGALPPDIAVNIIAFSSDAQVLWDAPRVLDEASLIEAVRWVARLRPMDETHPLAAVQRAVSMQSDQVIMLTDGRPTYADSEEPALMGVAGGMQAGVRLDVVGIGPDQNAVFLDALARRGHGIALHF